MKTNAVCLSEFIWRTARCKGRGTCLIDQPHRDTDWGLVVADKVAMGSWLPTTI